MLTITITPTTLVFKDLTDEVQEEIIKKFDFEFYYQKDLPTLKGEPKKLYKMLYLLTTVYDIELT